MHAGRDILYDARSEADRRNQEVCNVLYMNELII